MRRSVHWVVLAGTLLAAVLRLHQIDTLPPAAWWDEIWFGLRARELLQTGDLVAHYTTNFGGASSGPAYMTAAAHLLGFDTVWGGRLIPALAGVLSVPLGYACFRELLRHDTRLSLTLEEKRWAAALTALVLSSILFYTTTNRTAMEIGVAPATALFVIWQMARGAFRGKWGGWLLAGLGGGIAQYNGLHARFVLPVMAVFFLLVLLVEKERGRLLAGGAALAAVGAVVSLPLSIFFLNNPEWFSARAQIVTVVGPGLRYETFGAMLADNTNKILRVFFIEGCYDPMNGFPGLPLLDWIQAGGFLAGLVWMVQSLVRSTTARLLPLWMVLVTLPSLLTEGAPNLGRMIGIVAPLAALVGIGWVVLFRWVRPRLPGIAPVAIVLVLLSGCYHSWRLLRSWPSVSNLYANFTAEPVDTTATLIEQAEAGQPVYVQDIPELETPIVAFDFMLPGTPVRRMDFRKCLPLPNERPEPTQILIIDGRDPQTPALLRDIYPDVRTVRSDLDLWQTSGLLLEIPANASAPPPPNRVEAQFAEGIALLGFEWSGAEVRPVEALHLTAYWHVTAPVPRDLTAFAHIGTGLPDGTPLIAQQDHQPCLGLYTTSQWQPGEVVRDGFTLTVPPDAAPGTYPLALGWYAWPSLDRLPLLEAQDALPDNRVIIGQVTVAPP
ncbi:MAG: hypothetical protein ACFB51_00030 [Anaerolineae bacterium]